MIIHTHSRNLCNFWPWAGGSCQAQMAQKELLELKRKHDEERAKLAVEKQQLSLMKKQHGHGGLELSTTSPPLQRCALDVTRWVTLEIGVTLVVWHHVCKQQWLHVSQTFKKDSLDVFLHLQCEMIAFDLWLSSVDLSWVYI